MRPSPAGQSNPELDFQSGIIFGGNGGAKINKFLDYIEGIVIDGNLSSNTLHGKKALLHASVHKSTKVMQFKIQSDRFQLLKYQSVGR